MLFELETDERYEFWDGRKIDLTPSSMEHEFIMMNVAHLVTSFVRKHQLGRTFGSNFAMYLHGDVTNREFRMADFSFVRTERLDIVQSRGIYGAPDLCVEILSTGKRNAERDRVEKYGIYEQFGVQEYWIVNPYEEEIEMYGLQENKFVPLQESWVLQGIQLKREEIFE